MFTFIGMLVLLGVILWAINYAIPMDPFVKRIVTAVVVVVLVAYTLHFFGLLPASFNRLGNH